MGAHLFSVCTLELLLTTQAYYLLIAFCAASLDPVRGWALYYNTCAVGFSGVLFGYKVCDST